MRPEKVVWFLAGVALGHALAHGDWFPLLGVFAAAIFGALVVLIFMAADLAVRVAGSSR